MLSLRDIDLIAIETPVVLKSAAGENHDDEDHEHDDNRSASIRDGLTEYYAEQLADHGYAGSREEMLRVMSIDIELNAQGLEFWLEKRKQ